MSDYKVRSAVKKPIPVEFLQFVYTPNAVLELGRFCGKFLGDIKKSRHIGAFAEAEIFTLEDGVSLKVKHIAREGDYIVKGPDGEYWPVRKEIFEKTYEIY